MREQTTPRRRSVRTTGAKALVVGLALLTAVMTAPVDAAQDGASAPLVLRIYNVYGVSEADLELAHVTVREIFKGAGLQIIWRNCSEMGGDPCRERPGANEVIVRLIGAPHERMPSEDDLTLGVSLVRSEVSRGSFTSVYPDRIGMIAHRFGRDHDLVLGRAIAHELGHLLLGMTAHATSGLMRARWSERPLQASSPGDWIFSPAEARQLRDVARLRSTPRTAERLAAVDDMPVGAAKGFKTH